MTILKLATKLLQALELLEEVAGETVAELNSKCGLDNDTTTQTEVARDQARPLITKAKKILSQLKPCSDRSQSPYNEKT